MVLQFTEGVGWPRRLQCSVIWIAMLSLAGEDHIAYRVQLVEALMEMKLSLDALRRHATQ